MPEGNKCGKNLTSMSLLSAALPRALCSCLVSAPGIFNSFGIMYVISSSAFASSVSGGASAACSGGSTSPPKAEECEPPNSSLWLEWLPF